MRKYLRAICKAQGIAFPSLGHKIRGDRSGRARKSSRGRRRRAAMKPTLYQRVQGAVNPEKWLGEIRKRKDYRMELRLVTSPKCLELLGIFLLEDSPREK